MPACLHCKNKTVVLIYQRAVILVVDKLKRWWLSVMTRQKKNSINFVKLCVADSRNVVSLLTSGLAR